MATIVLFSDFGLSGPYVGQMTAAVYRNCPDARVINLFADAPSFDPQASAYLLASYVAEFEPGTIFLCVVDPGVGSSRRAVVLEADGRLFVGPDNGLFSVIAKRAENVNTKEITWKPNWLSKTFHGRDLFAPIAAKIAKGESFPVVDMDSASLVGFDWPRELQKVVYVDIYGNVITGLRALTIQRDTVFSVAGKKIHWAERFSSVQKGHCFWYENSNGLVELAVREGNASKLLGLEVGDEIASISSGDEIGGLGRAHFG